MILLDWSDPWLWMRQLREWILLLRTVLVSLSDECKETMEEVMLSWRDRGRGGGTNLDGTGAATGGEGDVALPVGPGEWEDALGLPLCVVCQNVSCPAVFRLPAARFTAVTNDWIGREDGASREDTGLEGGGSLRRFAVHAECPVET